MERDSTIVDEKRERLDAVPDGNFEKTTKHESPNPDTQDAAPGADEEKANPPGAKDPGPAALADFPEGGRKAWLTVSGAAACLFVSFGWVNCIGVFQEYYQTHQLRHYTGEEVAWIPSLQIFFMLFGGIITGKVFDSYGPRPLLLCGLFLHVFGLMMASLAKSYYQILLSQSVCSGIGASMVFYPSFTCVSTWFRAKRGMAMGLVVAGSSLGGVIFPIMIMQLLPEVGFGWTMRICAFLILALLIYANLTMASRIKPTPRPFHIMEFIRPFKELQFCLLTAAIVFFYWGMFIPFDMIVVVAQSHGMSNRLSNYLVPILNATSILGRTIPNAIADRVGHFNVMVVTAVVTTVFILALWLPSTGNAPQIVFASLFGASSGAAVGLTPTLIAKLSPIDRIGVRVGAAYALAAFAGLTGSPIGGKIANDDNGGFRYAIVFGGVSCAVGTVFYFLCRVAHAGWGLTARG